MASLKTCIKRGLKNGSMSPKMAKQLSWEYDQWIRAADDGGKLAGRHLAEARTMQAYADRLIADKRHAMLRAATNMEIEQAIYLHPKGPAVGAMAHLAKDLHAKAASHNIDKRTADLMAQFNSLWADSIASMKTTKLGFEQDRALIRDTMLEIHGKDTGNKLAARNAAGWRRVSELARDLFNEAGGNIKFRDDWFSPQFHDRFRIHKAGDATWKTDIEPLLALDRMVDPTTGRPFDPAQLPKVLDETYKDITTGGMSSRYSPNVSRRHTDRRFFVFKDADSWMSYQERYGAADQHRALTGHLRGMAREIAAMQILGPDPTAGYKFMRDLVAEHYRSLPPAKLLGYQMGAAGGSGEARLKQMDHVFDVVMGNLHPANVTHAQLFGSLQAYLSGSKLGSAVISALSDFSFLSQNARWDGLQVTRLFNRYMEQIAGGEDAKIRATKIVGASHGWLTGATEADRYSIGDGLEPYGATSALYSKTRRFSDVVMRATGLEAHTNGARTAFGMEFMGTLGDHAHQTLKQIDAVNPGLSRALKTHGVSDADWDFVRSAGLLDFNGAKYISLEQTLTSAGSPKERVNASRAVSSIMDMVETEMDYAIPVPDARVRGHLTQGTNPGTFLGTLVRGGALFRSFPITVIYTQWARGLLQTEGMGQAGNYLAQMILGTTLFGGISYQAKQLVTGKDPIDANPWSNPSFLGAAFLQGGGGSIMADFLVGGANAGRHGNSVTAVLAGPVWGSLVQDVHSVTLAQLGLMTDWENPQLGRSAVEFARRYNPGSSLLYTRLALDRILFDNLSARADRAKFQRSVTAKEQYARDLGTAYYWPPGESTPKRAPRLLGGRNR